MWVIFLLVLYCIGTHLSWFNSCLGWTCNLKTCHASCCRIAPTLCWLFPFCFVCLVLIDRRACRGCSAGVLLPHLWGVVYHFFWSDRRAPPPASYLLPFCLYLLLLALYMRCLFRVRILSHVSHAAIYAFPTYEPLFDVSSLASRMHA